MINLNKYPSTDIEKVLETGRYDSIFNDGSRFITVNNHKVFGYCRYAPFYKMIVENADDGCHFVEVGSFLGQSTVIMAYLLNKYNKNITFDCVDLFCISEYSDGEHENYITKAFKGEFFETFIYNLTKPSLTHKINNIHKMTSLEAAKKYNNQSLDFIYLDASHETEDLYEDIKAWWPKLKMGGLLAGDDLDHVGVPKALAKFFIPGEEGRIPNSRSFPFGTWVVHKL